MVQAAIYGVAGTRLTADEAAFLRDADPWGFIVFRRNLADADDIRRLCADLREAVGRNAPVLIDQEGGRVARLVPPLAPRRPPMDRYGELAKLDPSRAQAAAFLGAKLLARDCRTLGIDVNCAPVLDVRQPDTHDAIGDRALARDARTVARLGRAVVDGTLAGGCLPVVKHVPGQGRAEADSHLELPRIRATRAELEATDFAPFRALADAVLGMTTHVVFEAIDPERPCTQSRAVVEDAIRGACGFDGLLMTDDLSMHALGGGFAQRAERALDAGCDLVLHCNGDMAEMRAVAVGAAPLTPDAERRSARALAMRPADAARMAEADEAALDEMLRPVAA